MVARESPDLPACCGCLADLRGQGAENNGHKHDCGAGPATSGVVEDGDEGRLCAVVEDCVKITGAEDDGQASGDTRDGVYGIRDYQRPWDCVRGVSCSLGCRLSVLLTISKGSKALAYSCGRRCGTRAGHYMPSRLGKTVTYATQQGDREPGWSYQTSYGIMRVSETDCVVRISSRSEQWESLRKASEDGDT